MSTPTRMLAVVDVDELAALLAVASEARQVARKADEHERVNWTNRHGKLTLPLGATAVLRVLVKDLDEVQERLAKEN